MLRRDTELAFAGGAWVFPGGRIDPEDYPGGVLSTTPTRVFEAARHAAVREAMEEAGLVVDPDGLVWFAHWTPPTVRARSGGSRPGSSWPVRPRARSPSTTARSATTSGSGRPTRCAGATPARSSSSRPPGSRCTRSASTGPVDDLLAGWRPRSRTSTSRTSGRVDGVMVSMWAGRRRLRRRRPSKPGPRHRLLMGDDGWRRRDRPDPA